LQKKSPSLLLYEMNETSKPPVNAPLSLSEMQNATKERLYEISREFEQGFRFLEKFPRSVTFFGSTRVQETDEDYIRARNLAQRIVKELSYTVISGGGPGVMEAANRGALEVGGNSIGLTIRLPKEQIMNSYLSEHVDFYYFFSRKVCLAFSAEAFVFFPGGYGTLDEFFEIVTLHQTHKIPKVPVILYGSAYWNKLLDYMKENILSRGMIDEVDLSIFTITDDEEEVLSIIKNAPVRVSIPYEGLRVNPID
jgi:uncharacterized protein (TIGR00730 family)